MKLIKILVVLASFFVLTNCTFSEELPSKKELENSKKKANTLLNNWHKAAADAHYTNYFNAMDSISVFIGTDATENWTKPQFQAYSKPYFDKGKAWSFTVIERNLYASKNGKTLWFDELLITQMGTCRGSGVIEKTNNGLKIKHYVLSITIPNDDVKAVIEVKREKDSLFLKTKLKNNSISKKISQ